jgi:xanthine dehydrogenase YagR molybdenum-binding subunit
MTTTNIITDESSSAPHATAKLVAAAAALEDSCFAGVRRADLAAADGVVFVAADPRRAMSFEEVVRRSGRRFVEGEGSRQPGSERDVYAFQSFGAQFVEVAVDPELARVRVARVVGVFDVGRIISPQTARSQGHGGVIMGIGMALMERTTYDPRDGGIVTSNLADYAIPVNADVGSIDIQFIDKPDPFIDADGLGARGCGEITITGVAPAIARAIHHATGRRIRELPITPDKLLS